MFLYGDFSGLSLPLLPPQISLLLELCCVVASGNWPSLPADLRLEYSQRMQVSRSQPLPDKSQGHSLCLTCLLMDTLSLCVNIHFPDLWWCWASFQVLFGPLYVNICVEISDFVLRPLKNNIILCGRNLLDTLNTKPLNFPIPWPAHFLDCIFW